MNTKALIGLAAARLKYLGKHKWLTIDDWVFKLHYRFTWVLFLVCSGIIAWTEYFGSPIMCIKGGDVPDKVLNRYCWIEGTFTLPKALIHEIHDERDLVLPRNAHPGVRKYIPEEDDVIGHAYYQWVTLILFFQALGFYVTHELWKRWEGNRIKTLVQELNLHILKEETKAQKKNWLVNWLIKHRGQHESYALKYTLCEGLNLIHVIFELFLIDWFVGGEFWQYGAAVLHYLQVNQWERVDPMVRVFPKITKCTFHRFGSSGDVMKFDNLCLLPLNILNEKVYVVLWFWLIALLAITSLWLLYRFALIISRQVRFWVLLRMSPLFSARRDTRGARDDPSRNIEIICDRLGYSDWFLLYMLGWNLHSLHFKEVLEELAYQLDENSLEFVVDSATLPVKDRPNNQKSEDSSTLPSFDAHGSDGDSEKKAA